MYLKKVEIQGFKSFGERVNLEIPQGITVVVGPNGCGKSNIADAMRWVLGEQSARLLRGVKMEDVIFAGTQNRKGLGYAQVAMTIDNSERYLPIDYTEVVISRRVYRSGESEYLLNKSPCRLRDIQELLMGTGVGREGYSIIGQGQIDSVLSSKPEDRRNLFEEAAGIYKYKLKKLEAEKKLEKENENLVRVQDILIEIESRLETLGQQAEQAKKYMSIKESLKIAELNIFLLEVDKIEKDILALNKSYNELKFEYDTNSTSLREIKQMYEEIREKLLKLQEQSTGIQVEIANVKMCIEKHEGNIKLNREKINAIDDTNRRIQKDNEKRNNKSAEQEIEKQMLDSRELEIKSQILKEEENLSILQKEYEEITSRLINEEVILENHKKEMYQLLSHVGDAKASIEKGNTLSGQMETRKNKITESLNIVKSDIMHQDVRLQVLYKEKASSQEELIKVSNSITDLNKTLDTLENQRQRLYTEQRNVEDSYHRAYSKHTVLNQMKNEYEGFQRSVKNILMLKQKNPLEWQGIHGVVGELITVPKELEIAIDVALGGSIGHLVVKDEAIAKKTIEHIKKNNLGRATFLPLSAVKAYPMGADATSILNDVGVIGFGSNLIEYNEIYSEVIKNLLGRVIIVDTLDNAIQLAKKYKYRYRVVTLQGEVLNPGGSITGGSFNKNRENVFSRNREVSELQETIDKCKRELNNISNEQRIANSRYDDLIEQKKNLEEQKNLIEKEQMAGHIEINKVEETLKQTKVQQSNLEEEKTHLEDNYEKMFLEIHNSQILLEKAQLDLKEINGKINQTQEVIQKIKDERDSLSSKITEFKVSLSSKGEILHSTMEQIQRIIKDINYYSNENQTYEEQLQDSSRRRLELEKEIQRLVLEIQEEEKLLEHKNNDLEQIKKEETLYIHKEKEKRQEQDRISERSSLLQAEIYRMENKITKSNMDKENIFQKVWDDYEATYQSAQHFKTDLGSITQMHKMANEYKGQIRDLGSVNVGAVEEYEETKERYEFLSEHEQDILKAEKTLRHLIEELTRSMEEIFAEQFEKISHNFNIVFTELFGGGQAFLQLTDKDNLLESGIEIIAQPPGKKLQNMMLLSGGERALTAIAILFGILRLKPSPFAILDEIEAALDDANVARFSEYLKKMGNQMQFIVITHRKGTMEVADTMYGVTMEEQGISKIVSVKLDERQKYAKANAT